MAITLDVECYSGFKADERPVRFKMNGNVYFVEEMLDQWYGPGYVKVRADDGKYISARSTTTLHRHGLLRPAGRAREEHQGDFACTPRIKSA